MAFRPIRNSDSTVAISVYDPALDWAQIDAECQKKWVVAAIRNPAAFRDHVKVKSGENLCEFEIGVVPVDTLVRIADECPPVVKDSPTDDGQVEKVVFLGEGLRWRCFCHGLRGIKNWQGEKPKTKTVDGVEYVDPEWIRGAFVRGLRQVALDIGAQIWRWNNITEEESKN